MKQELLQSYLARWRSLQPRERLALARQLAAGQHKMYKPIFCNFKKDSFILGRLARR